MTDKEGSALLGEIQNRIYNSIATQNELILYFDYVRYLGLLGAEIEKINPELLKQAAENIKEQVKDKPSWHTMNTTVH